MKATVKLIAISVSLSLINQAMAKNAEKLKSMEWAVGSWNQVAKQDGKSQDWQSQFTPNRNAILVSQFIRENGQTKGQLDALFEWDKNGQQSKSLGTVFYQRRSRRWVDA